jgi:MFS transporter, putative metabolite:H+ symporter
MQNNRLLQPAVIIAALGYFVDIYDLLLFGFVRMKSLSSLGYSGQELTDLGVMLNNFQMGGMLVGGILWGILGDKKGRVSVLYFSIALYSLANIANGFAPNFEFYAACRLIAGIGLAGELGAGITLVAEILPKEKRGYGTTLVACIGLSGAWLAGLIDHFFDWRTCFFIGGGLGLALLVLRVSVAESGIFQAVLNNSAIGRGNFLSLFATKSRFIRFLRCILIGSPTWFVVGVLIMFSPEFAKKMGILDKFSPGTAIVWSYSGVILGDIVSGLLSQKLRSRLRVMQIFLAFNAVAILIYLLVGAKTLTGLYFLWFILGLSTGFWVIFVTIGAEQFGTNLRATVATTVPNFARGMLVPITLMWQYFSKQTGDIIVSALIVGGIIQLISWLGLWGMDETFDRDLDYLEE